VDCHIQVLLDSEDLEVEYSRCTKMVEQGFDQVQYVQMVQWREMLMTMKRKGI
jgi:hypothetical protein